MSTGDEVVEPATQKLGPGQIRDANRSMLLAAASQAGAQVSAACCTSGACPSCFRSGAVGSRIPGKRTSLCCVPHLWGVPLLLSGQVQGSPCMAITP